MNENAKTQLSKERKAKNVQVATWVLIGIAVVIGGFLYIQSIPPAAGMYDAFAKCIASSGATFYGASWCPHCAAQKAEFGSSAQYFPYVECSYSPGTQTQVCIDKGIQEYPTWYFSDGSSSTGALPLDTLAQKTGCSLPTSTK